MQLTYGELKLIEPHFSSPLVDLIIELDHLRRKKLGGSTHPRIFFQLKSIFHLLESLESARIEGNRTTLAELVDRKVAEPSSPEQESWREIQNVEVAISFIDDNVHNAPINRAFISELHKLVVSNLSPEREGDFTPGHYRRENVSILNASHKPPDFTQVETYMEELLGFINSPTEGKYDLLKTALAHHRFMWIHPFRNGNGRTGRLLTYAMLVKQNFNVNVGRILNPTAVFCEDRDRYNDLLAAADGGDPQALLNWCEYVLSGLKREIEKIDKLLDYEYLSSKILRPMIGFCLDRKIVTETESKILGVSVEKQLFQADDLKRLFPSKLPAEISRMIRHLKDKKMIEPLKDGGRKYHIKLQGSFLLRGAIAMLLEEGFIPMKDENA